MAISVTNIGNNSNAATATVALTGVTIPAGSLIVVLQNEGNTTGVGGAMADTLNTYTAASGTARNASNANGFVQFWYAWNSIALSAGTITYTKKVSGVLAALSVFYATGIQTSADPLDGGAQATATGSSSTPSVTSGTPNVAGDLFVAGIGVGTATFTQDSGNGWAVPPAADTAQTQHIAGGNQVNAGTGTITFAPSLGASNAWAAIILGFKQATLPFNKSNWPLTQLRDQPARSFVQSTDLSLLAGAGAKPFAKYDWPLSVRPVQPDRSFIWSSDIAAYLAKFPFAKYDWSLTQTPPPDKSYVQGIALFTLANSGLSPFAKYDWPLSVLPILPDRSYVQSIDLSPLAGAGTKPFAKQDWPLTVLPVLNPPGYTQPIDLAALSLAGAKPFAKYDWPLSILAVLNPPGFMQAVDLSALANAGLVPFAKYDWPLSVPPVLNPPGYTWSTSGPLIPQLGSGRRRPLFIESASGFPASYWPDGS